VTVVVLDACRNNPFTSSGTKGIGGEKGLAPHEPPSGVFTLYAASRGESALDRLYDGDRNPNSVFTRALLPALLRPGLDLPGLALEVRKEVTRQARTVNHTQRPAYYDETSGDRIFLAGTVPTSAPPIPTLPSPSLPASPGTDLVIPVRVPGCMIKVFQYPTSPKGETKFAELSATQILETGRIERDQAEIAFKEGGRAWTDAALLKAKRTGGRCAAPTFPLLEPVGDIP
jgi:hypothetical protein